MTRKFKVKVVEERNLTGLILALEMVEIKRKIEVFVHTKRRFTLRQGLAESNTLCVDCGGVMLAAEQTAIVCGISRRGVYRIVEDGNAHFIETDTGVLLVCPDSMADHLEKIYENKI